MYLGDARRGPGRMLGKRSLIIAVYLAAKRDLTPVDAHGDVFGLKLGIPFKCSPDLFSNIRSLRTRLYHDLVADAHHAKKLADVHLGGVLLIVPVDVAAQRDPP